jgi:hypothetical protein
MARLQKVNRPHRGMGLAENNLGYEQSFKLQEYPMPLANTPDFGGTVEFLQALKERAQHSGELP